MTSRCRATAQDAVLIHPQEVPKTFAAAAVLGGGMDRSARVFSMPSFWQQITPLRYTVLDWEQAREIPAISYLT